MTEQEANDPRLGIETLYTSSEGIGVTAATSVLSILASWTIIVVIARSSIGFGSVYHRIMLGISTADILQSCAMALTTVPMPRNMIYEQFEGLVLGTNTTCSIQGFVYICGFLAGTMYTTILCYYYLCAIRFRMHNDTFQKYIEPASHIFAIGFTVTLAALSWEYDLIHPTPLHPFCTTSAYPYWCRTVDVECMEPHVRIRKGGQLILWPLSTIFFAVNAIIILVCLATIVCSIYAGERKLKQYFKSDPNLNMETKNAFWSDFTYTKSVVKQSIYYVGAFVAVYMFHFITAGSDLSSENLPPLLASKALQIAYVILRPSQGTLNLIIFLYHKVWSLRRQYPTLGLKEALVEIVIRAAPSSKDEEGRVISHMEIVARDDALKNIPMATKHGDVDDDCNIEDSGDVIDEVAGSMFHSVDVMIKDVHDQEDPSYCRIQTPVRNRNARSNDTNALDTNQEWNNHKRPFDGMFVHKMASPLSSDYGAEMGSSSVRSNGTRDIFSILDSIQMLGSRSNDQSTTIRTKKQKMQVDHNLFRRKGIISTGGEELEEENEKSTANGVFSYSDGQSKSHSATGDVVVEHNNEYDARFESFDEDIYEQK